ncbi:GrpB family protein [Pseudarthrobacter sp. Y6]|uniref:GrpB family protein n=1 Tax=Pseudarthrobacter sp. Y6 TaxID=3418422 RepID=UPI003CE809D1
MSVNGVEYLRGRDSLNGRVELVAYDVGCPEIFCDVRDHILSALGSTSSTLEHVGSTSVPGLASKPVIDIVLLVKDSAAEETYIPQLEAVGFLHHLREPGWLEHRLLKHKVHQVNLQAGGSEMDFYAGLLRCQGQNDQRPSGSIPLGSHIVGGCP